MARPAGSIAVAVAFALVFGAALWMSGLPGGAGGPSAGRAGEPAEAVAAEEEAPKSVYTSPLARKGWYPADAETLRTEIQRKIDAASGEPLEDVQALLLPHAGYRWSGGVAAHGIKAIADASYDRVVVLGPTHRLPLENVASVPPFTHYRTPLGEVPLDVAFLRALREHSVFVSNPDAHAGEHSVQIEVPLLQVALGSFRLVPIVVGQLDADTAARMAGILSGLVDDRTLVVVSSDFTHYGGRFRYVPFTENIRENLKKLDLGAYEHIAAKDAEAFESYVSRTDATICGRHPIRVLLGMLPSSAEAHLLTYDTSGRVTGSYENSVSYLAAAFTGKWVRAGRVKPAQAKTRLREGDRRALLKLARDTIAYALEHEKAPRVEDLDYTPTPGARQVMGAFVTLHKNGRLRGCIGEIFPRRPLYKAVLAQAINAAFQDRRFPQVEADELPALHIEISALTPPRAVASYKEIEIGTHGMVIQKHGRSAVYLPQVAPEQGWDLAETLTHLSRKAGLPADAWKEGASFTVFDAIVFSEPQEDDS